MAAVVYVLGAITTSLCATLLLLGYSRSRQRLLLFSGLCFVGLAVSNALIFVDLVVLPEIDLYIWRLVAALIGMSLMLYALIWERD